MIILLVLLQQGQNVVQLKRIQMYKYKQIKYLNCSISRTSNKPLITLINRNRSNPTSVTTDNLHYGLDIAHNKLEKKNRIKSGILHTLINFQGACHSGLTYWMGVMLARAEPGAGGLIRSEIPSARYYYCHSLAVTSLNSLKSLSGTCSLAVLNKSVWCLGFFLSVLTTLIHYIMPKYI